MKRISFFATPQDISPVLARFEASEPVKFVLLGNLTNPNRAIYLRASDIPDPGISTHETGGGSTAYLVSPRDHKNHMRKFTGNKGENRWTIDNADNESSVVLTMAGLWTDGTLLPGLIATLHQTPAAQGLMRRFHGSLKAEKFVKVRNWWLGVDAMGLLKSGSRLSTTAVQSPAEFDLKIT